MPLPSPPPRKHTDESFVFTAVVSGLLVAIAAGYLLVWYLEAQHSREMNLAKDAAYQQYLRHTRPEAPKALSTAMTERMQVRSQLLAHPAVKPGPGFAAPGVQSTGKAIIDAIDRVQGRPAASI